MNPNQIDFSMEITQKELIDSTEPLVSIESEIPEILYMAVKEFISLNPSWDNYKLMSSAIANFLFQNGCEDRVVTEKYLNDLFNRYDCE